MANTDIRIPYEELISALTMVLKQFDFQSIKAERCATLFAKADLDGVRSHGVNRFLRFIDHIQKGQVIPTAQPEQLSQLGFFERWDGKLGAGNLNADFAMNRAILLAKSFGIGAVALANTNHWMRAGNYGWQAVESGCIGICFTNTKANMPAWGGSEPKLGNNPLVIAIPRKEGPIVLDMAMSQFAYGKMTLAKEKGEMMPQEAGFDEMGNLTKDPRLILENEMALPMGLWKGSGLSLMIDLLASILSGGNSVHEIQNREEEVALSQVFICLDPIKLELSTWIDEKADLIIKDLKASSSFAGRSVRYPGEQILALRKENMENGVPVSSDFWHQLNHKFKL